MSVDAGRRRSTALTSEGIVDGHASGQCCALAQPPGEAVELQWKEITGHGCQSHPPRGVAESAAPAPGLPVPRNGESFFSICWSVFPKLETAATTHKCIHQSSIISTPMQLQSPFLHTANIHAPLPFLPELNRSKFSLAFHCSPLPPEPVG